MDCNGVAVETAVAYDGLSIRVCEFLLSRTKYAE